MVNFSVYCAARAALIGTLASVCLAAAQAQSNIDGSSLAAILEVAKGYGSAELEKDSYGDPRIRGRLSGRSYAVYFHGCKGGTNCTSIQFHWGIDVKGVPLSKINEWNRTKRFGKAYLDSKGELNVELDVNMKGGLSKANLDDTFDFWKTVVTTFHQEFVESRR